MAAKKKRPEEFSLVLEKFRSFASEQILPIKPLTLLVGENSSGKTTILAAASVVLDHRFPMHPSFNNAPFELGSFDTIATSRWGRSGAAKSFALGYANKPPMGVNLKATYTERSGEPVVSRIQASMREQDLGLDVQIGKERTTVSALQRGKPTTRASIEVHTDEYPDLDVLLWHLIMKKGTGRLSKKLRKLGFALARGVGRLRLDVNGGLASSAVPMAPVRSKPHRTYSEMSSGFDPEGGHIPFMFSRLPNPKPGVRKKATVRTAVKGYGRLSGLFRELSSKRLGKKPGSPFQILVKGAGPPANLVDVGYGVGQALPIVVQTVLAGPHQLVLVQQPEVHLHPRAQAALGSFFADLVAGGERQLMVETHSDYIIDRVRMEVADGKLRPDQVVILYFEKEGLESKVYPIHLDKLGNMLDAPRSYRSFFLKERAAFITGKR